MLMRLDFEPSGPTRWKLAKAKMKMGKEPPRDMPIPEHAEGTTTVGKDDTFGEPVGREEVVVKGGKFIADHYRRKIESWTTEVWMDDKFFPVGLVKLEDGNEGSVQLVAQGKGGKSGF